jgi:hypothetical protein
LFARCRRARCISALGRCAHQRRCLNGPQTKKPRRCAPARLPREVPWAGRRRLRLAAKAATPIPTVLETKSSVAQRSSEWIWCRRRRNETLEVRALPVEGGGRFAIGGLPKGVAPTTPGSILSFRVRQSSPARPHPTPFCHIKYETLSCSQRWPTYHRPGGGACPHTLLWRCPSEAAMIDACEAISLGRM